MENNIDNLKNEKLALEIRRLKRPWYFEPSYLTLILTLFSLIVLYNSDLINTEKKIIEYDQIRLKKLNDEIESRESLNESYIQLSANSNDMYDISLRITETMIDSLKGKIFLSKELRRVIGSKLDSIEFIKNQNDSIKRLILSKISVDGKD